MMEWPTWVRMGLPAHFRHDLGHHVGADEVVEDGLARVLGQHGRGHQRRRQRARHGLRLLVDQEDAVGVPVEGEPDVGPVLEHGRLQRDQVLGLNRVGRVVREVAVELGEQDVDREGEPLEHDGHDQPAHAVGGVGHDLERAQRARRRRRTPRGRPTRRAGSARSRPPVRGGSGWPSSSSAPAAMSARPVSRPIGRAPDRQSLSPLYCAGLCEAVNMAPGRVEVARREVQEVGGGHAEVDDVDALGPHPVGEGGRQLHPALAHVAGHQDPRRAGEAGHGPADGAAHVGVELVGHRAPHVVRLEDLVHAALGAAHGPQP